MTDRLKDHPFPPPHPESGAADSPNGEKPSVALPSLHLHVEEPSGAPAPSQPFDEVQSAIESGRSLLAQGQFDRAASELNRAIRLAPENPEAFLLRGQVWEKQGDDDRALDDYSAALQIDVNQLLTFAQRLLSFTARRDFAGAVANADLSLQFNHRVCRSCFLRSAVYARRKEWARAIIDYHQILQLDPTNSIAFLRRGDAYAAIGEWARAVADYTECLRLDPQNTECFTNRGEALLRLGQIDQALADFTAALRLDSQCAHARTNRAETYLRRGEYEQAITDYNQAIQLIPATPRPYAGRAMARLEKGDWDRALADLARAISLDPALVHAAETQRTTEHLRTAHDQAFAWVKEFKRLFRHAAESVGAPRSEVKLPDATQAVAPVVAPEQANPTNEVPALAVPIAPVAPPASTPPESHATHGDKDSPHAEDDFAERRRRLAARHCRRGRAYQDEGDSERAIAAYSSALAVDPECVEAYQQRGLIHRLARRLDEAIEDFNTAIELQPSAELYFRRGVAFAEQREFKRAFTDFNEAIARDPNHALAYLNRGLISVVVGKFEEAAEDADKAIDIDPSLTRARFLRGVAHGKLGHHNLAVDDFDEVLAQEPENARAHNHRGLACAAEAKYAEAIAAYDEAIRLTPNLWAAHFNRGIAYHLNCDYESAVAAFTHFLGRRPQYAPAYHHRGLANQALGNHDAAIADFNQAIQLDPNFTEAYTSCLEATRLKYESERSANEVSAAPRSGGTKAPAAPRVAEKDRAPRALDAAPTEPVDSETAWKPERTTPSGVRTIADTYKTPNQPAGKIQLECPECGTSGLLDVRHLGKKFRCPGCQLWWRTNAAGNLEETSRPTEDPASGEPKSGIWKAPARPSAETESKSGVWKPPTPRPAKASEVTAPHAAAEALLATSAPAKSTAEATALEKPVSKPKPAVAKGKGIGVRRQEPRGLKYAALWVSTFARTRNGRWTGAALVVAMIVAIPFVFPSLFPSELKTRGQKGARAWLARDTELLKTFTDPTQVEHLPRWLEATPPPELNEDQGKAAITVSVERNDGDRAELLIQVKAAKANGTPAFYVFRHRWALRKGTWYLQPDIPAAGVDAKSTSGR